ncbi:MAG TPA: hypothetical protein VGM90_18680 [Kofleriaceae bacterium]
MSELQVLIVTSAGAASSAVVPVLAAIEAAGMRVRAIDVGNAGGGGTGVADRVRRALLGEGAERRLKRELELTPPDAAVVFDPHAAVALTVARDHVEPSISAAPVIGVVADPDPAASWANTGCDRYLALDELSAVALADHGVEGERILVVGAIGERIFADAGAQDRAALRTRFKLGGKVALVEVAGMGAEETGSLALQLSLLEGAEKMTFLFDAGTDVDAAAILRRQVPVLGLRGKLFGATADAALLWRAADVIVAKPRTEVLARTLLVGGKLVAIVDETIADSAKNAAALETRKRAIAARGLLLLASALDSAFGGVAQLPLPDGADQIADIVAAVAADKRGVVDERRIAAQAATRDRVRAASAAANAAAATVAMPGELEDLGGDMFGGTDADFAASEAVDREEIARLRVEVQQRKAELTKAMTASRDAAAKLSEQAKAAAAKGSADEAAQLEKKSDAERARMHALLGELAAIESELSELDKAAAAMPTSPPPRAKASSTSGPSRGDDMPRRAPAPSVDDALDALKRRAGTPGAPSAGKPSSSSSSSSTSSQTSKKKPVANVDDELEALKKKMASAPPKKK